MQFSAAGLWKDTPWSNLGSVVFTAAATYGSWLHSGKTQQACSRTKQKEDTEVAHASLYVEYTGKNRASKSCCFSSCFLEREQESTVHEWAAGCPVQPALFMVNQWKWDGMVTLVPTFDTGNYLRKHFTLFDNLFRAQHCTWLHCISFTPLFAFHSPSQTKTCIYSRYCQWVFRII